MAMVLAPGYFTADMARALPPDGNRYEVVWGELLVSPSPRQEHQRVLFRLARAVADYCDANGLGETMIAPADISWSADTFVQPDLFVITPDESGGDDWRVVRTLRLVAEVLSPGTARHDRFQKRKLYQARGVRTLWLVDVERAVVEVWTPETAFPTIERERIRWHPEGASAALEIELATLFTSRAPG